MARATTEPVYNLEVDAEHVYYVTSDGVLVHNAYPEGSFSISNWSKYPKGVPKPKGPFRLLKGKEYAAARKAANAANRAIHKADASLGGKQIHEVHPVKFGGSPTSPANKTPLTPQQHSKFTSWWNRFMHGIE